MTDTAPATTDEFKFSDENLEPGDLLRLTHEDGEIDIAIINIFGPQGIWGMGASTNNTWCGGYGRIIFYEPIRIGEKTNASFNQAYIASRLEVVPRRLSLTRNGRNIHLLW